MSLSSLTGGAGNWPVETRKTSGELKWAPIAGTNRIPYTGSSYVVIREALVTTFGEFPIRLRFDEEHVADANILRGMAAAAGAGGDCYKQLHDALLKYHALLLTDT